MLTETQNIFGRHNITWLNVKRGSDFRLFIGSFFILLLSLCTLWMSAVLPTSWRCSTYYLSSGKILFTSILKIQAAHTSETSIKLPTVQIPKSTINIKRYVMYIVLCVCVCERAHVSKWLSDPVSGMDPTESSVLHRVNTCTTYVSTRRKTQHLANNCASPARSGSVFRKGCQPTAHYNGHRRLSRLDSCPEDQI
jgi:hypothetical protein